MHGLTDGQLPVPQNNLLRTLHYQVVDGQYLIHDAQ